MEQPLKDPGNKAERNFAKVVEVLFGYCPLLALNLTRAMWQHSL